MDSYSKAEAKAPYDYTPNFNQGDALYSNKKYEDAGKKYMEALTNAKTDNQKAEIWHNMGNSYLQQKKYKQSVEAFKKSLLLNPNDNDTRYNLAYAMTKLKQQQQQQKKNQQKNDKNKKQNKDKKNQKNKQQQQKNKDQQKKQQQQKQQNQQKDQQKQGQQKQQQPQQAKNLNKEQAERLLKALQSQDQKLQEKYNKRKFKATKTKVDKDW